MARVRPLLGSIGWLRRKRDAEPGAPGDARLLRRVRLRLVLWSGGITLAIVVALGVVAYGVVAQSLAVTSRDRLERRAHDLGEFVQRGAFRPGGGGPPMPIGFAVGGASSGTYAIIVTPGSSIIGPTDARIPELPVQAGVNAARAGALDYREVRLAELPLGVLSEPVVRDGQTYVVQVLADRTAEERTLQVLLLVMAGGGLLAVVLALAGGTIYAQRALRPIRSSLRRQREFAADASHELRTPLAVIRGNLEHLERHPKSTVESLHETVEDARAEADHMTELVDSLLLLARADSGTLEVERVPTELADVAASALAGLEPLARGRSVELVLDASPVVVSGDPVRLRQLVTILVENAIRHAPPDTAVGISVHPDGPRAALTVVDAGPGIRPADLPHLFERFWRAADAPSGGVGLGLAIAAWIADRHGGSIDAGTSPGGGARFSVTLPVESRSA